MEEWATWLHNNEKSPNTIAAYLQDLRHFSEFFEQANDQPFTPDQLNATDIKAYFRQQDNDIHVAVNSRNRRLATLRVIVKWAVETGALEYDPTVSIKRREVERSPRDRSDADMELLGAVIRDGAHIKCAGPCHAWIAERDRVLWVLFTSTGLRVHEIASLTPEHFDFDMSKLTVIGKGNKKAVIDVPVHAMQLIADWISRNPRHTHIISDWDGSPLTTHGIRDRIRMIGEAAGGMKLNPHDLRHTYAYHLIRTALDQGMIHEHAKDIVRKQLRHKDSKTTDLYFRVRESQVRAAVEAM
jgi:integrase/recombinase XerC